MGGSTRSRCAGYVRRMPTVLGWVACCRPSRMRKKKKKKKTKKKTENLLHVPDICQGRAGVGDGVDEGPGGLNKPSCSFGQREGRWCWRLALSRRWWWAWAAEPVIGRVRAFLAWVLGPRHSRCPCLRRLPSSLSFPSSSSRISRSVAFTAFGVSSSFGRVRAFRVWVGFPRRPSR